MRFTARARLETWAHASRVQSDEVAYGLRMEPAALAAGDSVGAGGDGAGRADVDAVEHAARDRGMEMTDDAYRQLMKHAHRLAMDGHGGKRTMKVGDKVWCVYETQMQAARRNSKEQR